MYSLSSSGCSLVMMAAASFGLATVVLKPFKSAMTTLLTTSGRLSMVVCVTVTPFEYIDMYCE